MERLRRKVRQKPALSLAVMGLLLAGSIYASTIRPLQFRLEGLEQEFLRARTHQNQIDSAQARLSRLKEEFGEHRTLLREEGGLIQEETSGSEAISQIVRLALQRGLLPTRVSPSTPVVEEFLTHWPLDLVVAGGFHGLGRFFQDLAELDEIVNVRSLSISRRDPSLPAMTLDASISLAFFRINLQDFHPDQEQEQEEAP
ncbi:MAG: type 4a pilus biogenesis protein PilO [Candidatus Aminicenantes bacterium]|nr:type 4a pilus biogenesis protein PilO [Candidatus Aminicenantes bacterium]